MSLLATSLRCAMALLLSGLIAACGSDDDDAADTLSPPTQATIGPAGDTIQVPISAGVQAELEFPAGALRETVSLTLTPEAPEAGARMRLRVEPGDLALAKPLTLRLSGSSAARSGIAAFYVGSLGNRMTLPTRTDPASGELSASTLLLFLEPAPTLEAPASRSRRLQTGGGNAGFLNVAEMDCAVLLPELRTQILLATQSGFAAQRAYQLTQTLKAVESACASGGDALAEAELQLLIREIEQRACDALTAAVEDILLFTFPTAAEFYGRTSRLLGAQDALVSITSRAFCNPPMTMQQAYAKAMSDYIAGYDARVSAPGFGGPGWLSRRAELTQIARLHEDAYMLQMSAEQQAVEDQVLKPALAKLHSRAFQICRNDNPAEQGPLADLYSGGQVYGNAIAFLAIDEFGLAYDQNGRALLPPGIAQDIQYCASSLRIRAYEGTELLPEPALQLGGGNAPGAQVTQGTIRAPVAEGVLALDGVIRPLLCASPNAAAAYDPSTLVIKFNGVTVRELSPAAANFLPGVPLELDLQALYAAAGLDVNAPGDYPLAIYREGTGCGGPFYGDASFKLFEVMVTSADPAGAPAISVVGSSTAADLAGRGAAACFGSAVRRFTSALNSRSERANMEFSGPQSGGATNCVASVPGVTARIAAQIGLSGPQVSTTAIAAPASFSGGATLFERLQLEIADPAAGWGQQASASALVEVLGTWLFQASDAAVAYTVSATVSAEDGVFMSARITAPGQQDQYAEVCARSSNSSTFQANYCNTSNSSGASAASRTVSGVLQPGQVLQVVGQGQVDWQGQMDFIDFGASRMGESGSVQSRGTMSFQVTFSAPP